MALLVTPTGLLIHPGLCPSPSSFVSSTIPTDPSPSPSPPSYAHLEAEACPIYSSLRTTTRLGPRQPIKTGLLPQTNRRIISRLQVPSPLPSPLPSSHPSPFRSYLHRLTFYRTKHFQCEVTGKGGMDYFQAIESEQQEAKTLQARFPERLKQAVLAAVQWRMSLSSSTCYPPLTIPCRDNRSLGQSSRCRL